jgi:mannose-6-phosphate isomerase-like protein (cupin superfamily)
VDGIMATDRASNLRRVVTGISQDGKSVVAFDGPPDPVMEFNEGTGLYEIWTDMGAPLDRQSADFDTGSLQLCPPPGGVKIRWSTIGPATKGVSRVEMLKFYDNAFAAIGAHGDRPDTSRHAGMHLTQTIDFIVIIEGRVRLILDNDERVLGPGDVVVQRGTNHAWVCESETPVLFVAILIDKEFA